MGGQCKSRWSNLGLESLLAIEKSELRLFFDETEGIMPLWRLEGDGLPSLTFKEPGADFLRRLNDNMMGKENDQVKGCKVAEQRLSNQ